MPVIKLLEPNVNGILYGIEFINSESQSSVDESILAKIRAHGREFQVRQSDKHDLVQINDLKKEVSGLKKELAEANKLNLAQTKKYETLSNDYTMLMEQFSELREKNSKLEREKFIISKLEKKYKEIKEQ